MTSVLVRRAVASDRVAWQAIAETSAQSWLGHDWDWSARVEHDVWGSEIGNLVVEDSGSLVGIMPLQITRRRYGPFVRTLVHSSAWAWGGIAISDAVPSHDQALLRAAAMRAVDDVAQRERADKLVVRLPGLARDNLSGEWGRRRPLAELGLTETRRNILVVRTAGRGPGAIWDAFEGRARTAIRKAERQGVRLGAVDPSRLVDAYYALHVQTYTRTGVPPHPRGYFTAILGTPWSKLFFAEQAGVLVAALNVGVYSGRALYWTSASTEEGGRSGANSLLQWEAIQWLCQSGIEAYEMGELPNARPGSKVAGLALFKRSFGGEVMTSVDGSRVYRPAREAAMHLIRLARRG